MSARGRKRYGVLTLLSTAGLAAALFTSGLATPRPDAVAPLAQWLGRHPADWTGFARLSEASLDSDVPDRFALWHASHQHAASMAPLRPLPRLSFVRAGLFHWQELSASDRSAVKVEVAPLLRDPGFFERTYKPLFAATGDFELLRRNAPDSVAAIVALRDLAVSTGHFEEYRAMRRAELTRRLAAIYAIDPINHAGEMLSLLPVPLRDEHAPLVQRILEKLETAPLTPGAADPRATSSLIEFALDHRMKPLDGLAPAVADPNSATAQSRARLAQALGEFDAAAAIRLSDTQQASTWRQYHVERALLLARKGDFRAADVEIARGAAGELDPFILSSAAEIARLRRDDPQHAEMQRRLAAFERQAPQWNPLCGALICGSTSVQVYRGEAGAIEFTLAPADPGDVLPYVEVTVDGKLVEEGAADGSRRKIRLDPGLHDVGINVMNGRSGGLQRRVRMS